MGTLPSVPAPGAHRLWLEFARDWGAPMLPVTWHGHQALVRDGRLWP